MSGSKYEACPVCSSKDLSYVTKTFDRHYGRAEKSFEVNSCQNCNLLFLNPMITEKELSSMYDSDTYYSYKAFKTNESLIYRTLRFCKHLIISINPNDPIDNYQGLKVLDLGCGSGKYLYKAKKKGAQVYGAEIDGKAAEVGNKFDLNIKAGTLHEVAFEDDYFDYVRSNHSFEHLVNPVETIKEIHRITKKDGKVFIGVPNTKSINYKIFGKYWYYFGVPFHPFNYGPKNLKIILEQNGFKLEKVYYNGNYQGWVGSLQIIINSFKKRQLSHQGLINNQVVGALFHQLARLSNLFRGGDCIEVVARKL